MRDAASPSIGRGIDEDLAWFISIGILWDRITTAPSDGNIHNQDNILQAIRRRSAVEIAPIGSGSQFTENGSEQLSPIKVIEPAKNN